MRVCGPDANGTLTGEQRRHPLGRQLVRLREQVRVCWTAPCSGRRPASPRRCNGDACRGAASRECRGAGRKVTLGLPCARPSEFKPMGKHGYEPPSWHHQDRRASVSRSPRGCATPQSRSALGFDRRRVGIGARSAPVRSSLYRALMRPQRFAHVLQKGCSPGDVCPSDSSGQTVVGAADSDPAALETRRCADDLRVASRRGGRRHLEIGLTCAEFGERPEPNPRPLSAHI